MREIKLTNTHIDIDGEIVKWGSDNINKAILGNLWEEVVECDITLGNLLIGIWPAYPVLSIALGDYWSEFMLELEKPWAETYDDIEYLEVYWTTNAYDYKDPKIENDFEIWPSFHGVGKVGSGPEREDKRERWAIEMSPINKLANLPIRLNNGVTLYRNYDNEEYLGKREFTLMNFLKGIFHELTFYGNPKQRDDMLRTLDERVEELKDEGWKNEENERSN